MNILFVVCFATWASSASAALLTDLVFDPNTFESDNCAQLAASCTSDPMLYSPIGLFLSGQHIEPKAMLVACSKMKDAYNCMRSKVTSGSCSTILAAVGVYKGVCQPRPFLRLAKYLDCTEDYKLVHQVLESDEVYDCVKRNIQGTYIVTVAVNTLEDKLDRVQKCIKHDIQETSTVTVAVSTFEDKLEFYSSCVMINAVRTCAKHAFDAKCPGALEFMLQNFLLKMNPSQNC